MYLSAPGLCWGEGYLANCDLLGEKDFGDV